MAYLALPVASLFLHCCAVPCLRYSFVKLSEMENTEPNKILDVVGVVKSFEDYVPITTR